MKMKKGLLSVAFLLATSSAMAAMSFSSAEVKSDMTVKVVSTESALLALDKGTHPAAKIDGGKLKIDLTSGLDGGSYGVQKDSKYKWDDLFKVTNKSDHLIKVTVYTGATKPTSATYTQNKDASLNVNNDNKTSEATTFLLQPGDNMPIDINLTTTNADITPSNTGLNYDLKVSAERYVEGSK